MLLKITEKIIRRNFWNNLKKQGYPGVSANRPIIAPVKQNVLFTRPTHSGQCLLRLQALDTEPYDIFSKPSYNDTQFK